MSTIVSEKSTTAAAVGTRITRTFHDTVCIVTGGTSGIGASLCELLGAAGATVVVAGRNSERAENVASGIEDNGGRAHVAIVDVTNEESVAELIDGTVARYGRIDYLFNNAGVSVLGETRDLSTEHWASVIDVNLWGVVHGTTKAYEVMLRQGFGHIINVSSGAGLFPVGYNAPYSGVKHAVVALSRAMRAEAAAHGVTISVACPGAVNTAMAHAAPVVNFPREIAEKFLTDGMSAEAAAREILRGAARKRATIVFPRSIRFMWWVSRMSPALFDRLCLLHVKILRKMIAACEGKR